MGPGDPRGPHELVPADQVKLWEQLQFQYPEAGYIIVSGWYLGSLRDEDVVLKASSLQRLIAALTERG